MTIKDIKDYIRLLSELGMIFSQFKIGDEVVSFFDMQLLSIEGHEYLVFKYKDQVVKIHRNHFVRINNLNEENIKSLINIPTKRILMPTGIVYDKEDKIRGYTMESIENEKSISCELMDHFQEEITLIDNDRKLLSDLEILLMDIRKENAIYNGKINIVDSELYINLSLKEYDNYVKFFNVSIDNLKAHNIIQINKFLYDYITNIAIKKMNYYNKIKYLSKVGGYFKSLTEELKTNNYVEIIESISNKNATVEEFSKELVKKADINIALR